ncbi:hypothetical protein [Gordonia sihwensis]|uniref:hypothetical protein n=1 Tax=Gordonia sihwensis TaxID=173559 RepID=UPI003D98D429
MTAFSAWLGTFVDEKDLDTEHLFEVEGPSGLNWIPLAAVIAAAEGASREDQETIKLTLAQLDFNNRDPLHYFEHLAKGLAQ